METLLNSRIATAKNPDALRGRLSSTGTEVSTYPARLQRPQRSALHQELFTRYADFGPITRLFPLADDCRHALGSWCGDRYWSFAFSDAQAKRREAKLDRKLNKGGQKNGKSSVIIDQELARLQEAHEYVQNHELDELEFEVPYLSHRVLALRVKLQEHFERPTDHKCLVFVERKATARLLHDVVVRMGNPNLQSGFLTGTSSGNHDSASISPRQQAVTMMEFRDGTINCLASSYMMLVKLMLTWRTVCDIRSRRRDRRP